MNVSQIQRDRDRMATRTCQTDAFISHLRSRVPAELGDINPEPCH